MARRTGTATPLGARIDGEADAFLILLLSIVVSQDYGGWVLAIGAARYALLLAGWLIPWLAAPLPPRYWRKVVAAVQGIVLTVAASGVPSRLDRDDRGRRRAAAAGRVVRPRRDLAVPHRRRPAHPPGGADRRHRCLRSCSLWFDLVAPDRSWQFSLGAFVRIPVEVLVLVAVALVLPPWPRRIVATIAGILFGLLTLDKILNIAFYEELDRAFNPVNDWGSIRPAVGVVRDAIGTALTNVVLVVIWIGLALLVGAITAATIHITAVAARHRRGAVRGLAALTAVWALSAGLSLQLIPGSPVASTSAAGLAVSQVRATQAALSDPRRFEQATRSPDPEATIPASDLLTGLRGKDVLIVFVESYGQVAVQGTSFSPGVDAVLRQQNAMLTRAGWSTQSAWLTSPTFGGISWLAHSTLQSGLWVNSNQRYNELVASQRFTLSDAFNKAGWHTVADDPTRLPDLEARHALLPLRPALQPGQRRLPRPELQLLPDARPVHLGRVPAERAHPWPQARDGRDRHDLLAPALGPVADHGALEQGRQRLDIRPPARAERDPARHGLATPRVLRHVDPVLADALTSWVTELNDPNLVLILLGDHQPHTPSAAPGPATTCRSRSSPAPLRCSGRCLLALAERAAA